MEEDPARLRVDAVVTSRQRSRRSQLGPRPIFAVSAADSRGTLPLAVRVHASNSIRTPEHDLQSTENTHRA